MVTVENTESRESVLHRVGGGRYSWKPNFFVGDWLYFGFNKQSYSVLQVNETSYPNCIEENFINNITKGGRDVFNLTMPKPYYFISGRGYCFKRMKVAIFVQNYNHCQSQMGLCSTMFNSVSNFQAKLILVLILHVYYFESIAFLFYYILF
ncbi:hypothetical protein E1A91_A05G107500v1 [Gossypium mustelinum]|uniref:Phytocyanin domain-containing protein n=1 Tax=Gossypium mustelinum TaxID=34275 RepID=A0A5D2Z5L5_GOSMU|nr:hypothetical protein E1A91_A05G107500v1 [Gossypium mustelinum]